MFYLITHLMMEVFNNLDFLYGSPENGQSQVQNRVILHIL